MRAYNSDTLILVEAIDKKIVECIIYRPERKSRKILGITIDGHDEYFIGKYGFDEWKYTRKGLEKGSHKNTPLIIIDNIAYYKPYVELTFIGDIKRCEIFNTYEEALSFTEEAMNKNIKNPIVRK